jgi:hypothetical protein
MRLAQPPTGPAQGPLNPALAEAYRQGYQAALSAPQQPATPPSRKRKWLAFGTLVVGLGGAAGIVAYQKGYQLEAMAFGVAGAVAGAILSSVDVLTTPGQPTPRFGLSGVAGRVLG